MKNRIEILMQWSLDGDGPYWRVSCIKHMGEHLEYLDTSCGTWEQVTEQVKVWMEMFPPSND